MASIAYHKNKKTGAVYAYSVKSYWDKEKKAPRNKTGMPGQGRSRHKRDYTLKEAKEGCRTGCGRPGSDGHIASRWAFPSSRKTDPGAWLGSFVGKVFPGGPSAHSQPGLLYRSQRRCAVARSILERILPASL